MKRRVQFTEQVARFREYMPASDREKFERLVDRIVADPEGDDSHLVYTTDTVTRSAWEDRVMVHFVVTSFFVVVIELDIYDAARGFNEV
ncbi:hypothetical protein [Streptomyces hokutonensis]|uniref:hypothetical protein n=1 Tax=Streptomyces hokutonensis TaxID=1306990 RepID=UPI00146DD282|nr:hypothetical protein [Streptomyces hokutonensis]